jgi:hypothetical protein
MDTLEEKGSGWLAFAAIILIFAGLMRIIDAIWAFSYNGAVSDDLEDALLGSTLENYGWWWLIVGTILIISGFLILQGSEFGRWIGIIAAIIGGLSAMTWMFYYPIWSLVYVAISVVVIYALVVYGGRQSVG